MGVVVTVLILVLAGLVLALVSAPLRRARARGGSGRASGAEGVEHSRERESQERDREELEAAREAKYHEIRDTELDYRTGKLSLEDYQTIDADLRAEAIAILDRLERLTPKDA
jgi:flagellar biosynthesis/type III secretory pathway M-ring protein FliF/YscJ